MLKHQSLEDQRCICDSADLYFWSVADQLCSDV